MLCTICGHQLNEHSNFCENCGAPVSVPESDVPLRGSKSTSNISRKKKYKVNKKRVLVAISALLFLCAAGMAAFLLIGQPDEETSTLRLINEQKKEYLRLNTAETFAFQISGANGANPEFKIEESGKGQIKSITEGEGSKMTVQPPKGGYQPGRFYTVTLGEGTVFNNVQYEEVRILHLHIDRNETAKVVYRDDVREISEKDAPIKGHSFETEETCKAGDVFLIKRDNGQQDILCKVIATVPIRGKTIVNFEEPKIDEVYETIDINKTIVSDAKYLSVNKDVVLETAKKLDLFDSFFDDASALTAQDIEASVKPLEDDKIQVKIAVRDPANPEQAITLAYTLRYKVQIDILNRQQFIDCELDMTDKVKISTAGQEKEALQKEVDAVISAFEEKGTPLKKDAKESGKGNLPIFSVRVPIQDSIYFFSNFTAEYDLKASGKMDVGLTSQISACQGVFLDQTAVKLQYADAKAKMDGSLLLQGRADGNTGLVGELGIKLMENSSVSFLMKPKTEAGIRGYLSAPEVTAFQDAKGYYDVQIDTAVQDFLRINLLYAKDKLTYNKQVFNGRYTAVSESNVIKVKSVNLRDKYAFKDGKIRLGHLTATYEDRIDAKEQKAVLKDYALYIDGKKVQVKHNVIQPKVEIGSRKFKLEWKYQGKTYAYEKTVEVLEAFDFSVVTAAFYKLQGAGTTVDIEIPQVRSSTENAARCNAKINQYCRIGKQMVTALENNTQLPANYGTIQTFSSYRWYYQVHHYEDVTALVISTIVRGRAWGGWDAHYAVYYDNSTGQVMSPAAYVNAAGYSTKEVIDLAVKGKGSGQGNLYVPTNISDYESRGTTFYVDGEGRLNIRYGVSH